MEPRKGRLLKLPSHPTFLYPKIGSLEHRTLSFAHRSL